MCTEILVAGNVCSTRGELSATLGGEVIPDLSVASWPSHTCLCPLDIEATAKKYGMDIDYSDPMLPEFKRHPVALQVAK